MLGNIIIKIWNTLIEVYKEFSIESTIHGIKHTTRTKSISVRILWIIIVILSFLASAKLAMLFYNRHQLANMSTLIINPQIPTSIIPLPAVTICHGNIAAIQNVLNYLSSQDRISKEESMSNYSFNFGSRYIMSFLMKPLPTNDRISSIINGDGMKILIHEKYTYPGSTSFQFIASTGQEIIAKLDPTALSSSTEILNLPTTVRGCYMAKSPNKNHRYRADNCFIHCREAITRKLCGCVPFSASVMETNTDLRICNLTHISCLARITLQTYTLTLQDSECDCLPDCEKISYKVAVTKLPMSAIQYSPGKFYKAAAQISNATILHVTYAKHSATFERRELVLSWINLISSLGGVFSLFLGCSFISLVEIFYFFCVNFFYKLKLQRESLNSNNNVNKHN
ncbi:hypothetical protein M0802_006722 [Mischocyttarus mexicanus]|nr:hypothetical protein M0802_006722 [Mischocyttarus mexicanus]